MRERGADGTNRTPLEIADIFGRHGFIWGSHHDTMHFEYRPKLTARGQ